ncbi:MAG: PH domain-containing protein [Acidimicrobiales bacterium]
MTGTEADTIATIPLPASIRTLWRVLAAAMAAVVATLGVVIGLLADSLPLLLVTVGATVIALALWWWVIDLSYARWRWGIDDRWIERRSGVIVRTTQVVPRSRVQTLTTRTGPIDRRLGLSSIVIHTAGTHTPNLVIPHLEADAAERLRAELGG